MTDALPEKRNHGVKRMIVPGLVRGGEQLRAMMKYCSGRTVSWTGWPRYTPYIHDGVAILFLALIRKHKMATRTRLGDSYQRQSRD